MTRRQGRKQPSQCRDCGAAGYWVKTASQKNVLLDASPELIDYVNAFGAWPIDETRAPTYQYLREKLGARAVKVHFAACPGKMKGVAHGQR